MKFLDEKKYVGNLDQLISVRMNRMEDGKADGVRMLELRNRSGVIVNINTSRGMDIPFVSYNGENIGFISPCGVVAPAYYDEEGLNFLKSFTAGFMTTCGLKLAGAPCTYEGENYGLHGHVSHTPAEDISYRVVEDGDTPYIRISGKVRDAVIFGDKLALSREIRMYYMEKSFTVHDTVTNEGYKRARHMILYHCNIGYPILTPNSEVYIPSFSMKPRDAHAEELRDSWNEMQEPDPDYQEVCYYHAFQPDENGNATVAVFNHELQIGLAITFGVNTLDHFIEWKMMGARDYVLGLEPANSSIDGIQDAIDNGSMKYLEPQESVDYNLKFMILSSEGEWNAIKEKA